MVGCALALLVATVAPGAPLRKPARLAAQVLDHLAATLEACATELRESDEDAGDAVLAQARQTDEALAELNDATAEGLAVVRQSPFRRRQLAGVEAYAQLFDPLDHASRNLRVLARRCAVALWRGEEVPAPYRAEMTALAEVMRFMAIELRNGRLPTRARERLVAIGEATSHLGLTRLDLGRGHPGPGPLDHRRPAGADRDGLRRGPGADPGDGLTAVRLSCERPEPVEG